MQNNLTNYSNMNLLGCNLKKIFNHLYNKDVSNDTYRINFRKIDFTKFYINTFINRYDEILL